jgi:hypothetical protein
MADIIDFNNAMTFAKDQSYLQRKIQEAGGGPAGTAAAATT